MSIGWMPCSCDGGRVLGIFAAMKDSAVDLGVQRFHAAIEHLGEAGEIGDVFDRDPGIAQKLGGAASGDEFDSQGGELAGEVGQAGFIGDAENCALDAGRHAKEPLGFSVDEGDEDFISWEGLAVGGAGRPK